MLVRVRLRAKVSQFPACMEDEWAIQVLHPVYCAEIFGHGS